ncbi:MAG: tRNA adenosine(34) deaminase TadA [Breznakia sp.]
MDIKYMKEAIKEAKKAKVKDEVPIGAVLVRDNKIVSKAHNLREKKQVSTAHAEILAIEKACKKMKTWRLEGCTLYVTLEPCAMCSGAIILSRVDRVVYGASDTKGGCIESTMQMYEQKGFNHYPSVTKGILAEDCALLLRDFFKTKRKNKNTKSV